MRCKHEHDLKTCPDCAEIAAADEYAKTAPLYSPDDPMRVTNNARQDFLAGARWAKSFLSKPPEGDWEKIRDEASHEFYMRLRGTDFEESEMEEAWLKGADFGYGRGWRAKEIQGVATIAEAWEITRNHDAEISRLREQLQKAEEFLEKECWCDGLSESILTGDKRCCDNCLLLAEAERIASGKGE